MTATVADLQSTIEESWERRDAIDSKDLRNHHALAAADIAIVEGLDLGEAEAGAYLLAALPLKIVGADGAPVRAILWREEGA